MNTLRFTYLGLTICLVSKALCQPVIEWQRPLGGTNIDCAYSIEQTKDGGYIVAGHSESADGDATVNRGDMDYWVTKLNAKGELEWEQSYGGSDKDEAQYILPTTDGGYIIAGFSESSDGQINGFHLAPDESPDVFIVKTDSRGTLEWSKAYGGSARDHAYAIAQTTNGYIFVGYTHSADGDISINHGRADCWIVKIDLDGKLVWQHTFGGPADDNAYDIRLLEDGRFVVTGWKGDNAWVACLNDQGQIVWEREYGGSLTDKFYAIALTGDSGFVCIGTSKSVDGDLGLTNQAREGFDVWSIKLNLVGDIVWSNTYGGNGNDIGYAIKLARDGEYIICGETESDNGDVTGAHGQRDAWVMVLQSSGKLSWQLALGGLAIDEANDIVENSDGDLVFAGSTLSEDGDVVGQHSVWVSDFWVVKLAPPPGKLSLDGFTHIPATLSCLSTIDSIRINFPDNGTYRILSVAFTGKDQANFTCLSTFPVGISVSNPGQYVIPITFTPSAASGQVQYEAMATITIHDDATNIVEVLSVPINGRNLGSIDITIDPRFSSSTATAGEKVSVYFDLRFAAPGYRLEELGLQTIELEYQYNTDLLHIPNEELIWRVRGLPDGWSLDRDRSQVNEATQVILIRLNGNTPLADTTSTLCAIEFTVMLPVIDSMTGFEHVRSTITTRNNIPLVQPCATVTVRNTSFDLQILCRDRIVRDFMRDPTLVPVLLHSIAPNPASGRDITISYFPSKTGLLYCKIYNALGEEVRSLERLVTSGELGEWALGLSGCPAGAYVAVLTFNGLQTLGRFILTN